MTAPPPDYAVYKRALAGARLPAAFIDLDALQANLADLRQAIKLLEHKRPATENHRPWWRTLLGRD